VIFHGRDYNPVLSDLTSFVFEREFSCNAYVLEGSPERNPSAEFIPSEVEGLRTGSVKRRISFSVVQRLLLQKTRFFVASLLRMTSIEMGFDDVIPKRKQITSMDRLPNLS
jgi:hypothetical protein